MDDVISGSNKIHFKSIKLFLKSIFCVKGGMVVQWFALFPHLKKVLGLNSTADWDLSLWSLHVLHGLPLVFFHRGTPSERFKSASCWGPTYITPVGVYFCKNDQLAVHFPLLYRVGWGIFYFYVSQYVKNKTKICFHFIKFF